MDKNALLVEINTILGNREVAEEIESSNSTPASVAARLQQPGNTLVDDAVLESLSILEWEDVFQLAAFGMYPPDVVVGLNRALAEGTTSFRGAWGDFAREFEVPEELGRGTFVLLNKVSPNDNVLTRIVSWSAKLVDESDSTVKSRLMKSMPGLAEAMFAPAGNLAKAEKERNATEKYMNPHEVGTIHPTEKSKLMTTRMWQDPKKRSAKEKKSRKAVEKEIDNLTKLAKKAGSTPEEMFPMLYRDLMRERVRHS